MFSSSRPGIICVHLLFVAAAALAQAPYVLTPRDTGPAPAPIAASSATIPDSAALADELAPAYRFLTESSELALYFRDDRDVLAILDKRSGYLWKTGLDIPFNREIEDAIDEGADPASLPPREDRLNTTYTSIANSLVSIEYFDNANNIQRLGSSAYDADEVASELTVESSTPFRARLQVSYFDVDIGFEVVLRLDGARLRIEIPDDSLTGEELYRLASINIAAFFGASGGRQVFWNPTTEDYDTDRPKPSPDGYVLVPDGSGALIRFRDNSSRLSPYVGDVYGEDISQRGLPVSYDDFSVPHKDTYMPLFGVVHGADQYSFAAWAENGAEYMEIVAFPEEHTTYYTQAYPRFVYNRLYYQIYNRRGDGYYRTLEERNQFDAAMTYNFLSSPEGGGAGYDAIAQSYRQHLEAAGVLRQRTEGPADIPLRLDILMSDVSRAMLGHRSEVATTVEAARSILEDLSAAGISNITSSLAGFAPGGTVLFRPGRLQLLSALGSRREFEDAISATAELGVDLSFFRNSLRIGDGQVSPWGNAVRGASGYYNEHRSFQANAPVNFFYFARPDRAAQWIRDEARAAADLGAKSMSIDGLGHQLYSDYGLGGTSTVSQVIETYKDTLAQIDSELDLKLHLVRPNQYFWNQASSFLDAPLFSTQFLLETDTVPLLQMVLHGSMEVYAPYANFSFSAPDDVLRMIDYNSYPSFLVTGESAHILLLTNSAEFYSTQYELYRDDILRVYTQVNGILRHVQNLRWLGRRVLAPGVVENRYEGGTRVLVNYRSEGYRYGAADLPGLSAALFRPEAGVAGHSASSVPTVVVQTAASGESP